MKLNYKRTTLIGLAFMSILSFWQFYDQVIPYLLEYKFGLSAFNANSIMAIDNVLAIFMLPLFGKLSDKTNTKLGKRTPYILFGTVVAVILLNILAYAVGVNNFSLFLIVLIFLLFVMSTYRSPAVAYMPDVTPKPLRSKANAIINLVGYIGGIFSTIVMMILLKSEKGAGGESIYSANQSFTPVFVIISVFMLISVLVLVFTTNENKLVRETSALVNDTEDEEQNDTDKKRLSKPVLKSLIFILVSVFLWFMSYNAVTTAFSRYCVKIWGVDLGASSSYLLTATIVAIIAYVPLGFLSSAIGRKKTVLTGITLMALCYFLACFITKPSVIMYAIFGIVGIGWAAINVNSFPMIVEISSKSDIGKYTGYYYAFSMAAQVITPLLSGYLIDKLGFGYSILFPYAVLFTVLSFITMLFVKHGDSKPTQKKSMLENFDMED